jgi:hypothetical protein
MTIYLTQEVSAGIPEKLRFITEYENKLNSFFKERTYGDDLEVLYIALFCMKPEFERFFKMRKPKYTLEGKEYIYDGARQQSEDKSLVYELRLEYDVYIKADNIKPLLSQDILNSLGSIGTVKKIKDFDLSKFRSDFEHFFQQSGWL